MHITCEPSILYFGTPVVFISSVNENASYNLAPMSSAFWLGWRSILGLAGVSKTPQNMRRTGECVLNLPSVDLVRSVNRLACTTGTNPVPETKVRRGYRFEPDKFGISGLTPVQSETVAAPCVRECPVQLESKVEAIHNVAEDNAAQRGRIVIFEVHIQRVHLEESILMDGDRNRIDPKKWRHHELSAILWPRVASVTRFDTRTNSRTPVPKSRCRAGTLRIVGLRCSVRINAGAALAPWQRLALPNRACVSDRWGCVSFCSMWSISLSLGVLPVAGSACAPVVVDAQRGEMGHQLDQVEPAVPEAPYDVRSLCKAASSFM